MCVFPILVVENNITPSHFLMIMKEHLRHRGELRNSHDYVVENDKNIQWSTWKQQKQRANSIFWLLGKTTQNPVVSNQKTVTELYNLMKHLLHTCLTCRLQYIRFNWFTNMTVAWKCLTDMFMLGLFTSWIKRVSKNTDIVITLQTSNSSYCNF